MNRTTVMDRLINRTMAEQLPFSVHMDLTYRCNERCVHCYLEHDDHGEMTTAEIKSVLDELAAAGTLFLTFSGGEIFLRKDLFELLAYARKLHFDISLKTNALLICSNRAAKLKALGVRRIQISIYSADPAVHDAITLVPGSLARSLEAIRFLKAQGLHVKIACPLMKENLTAFRPVQALAEELEVPYVIDLTISPMMDGNRSTLAHRNPAQDLLPVLSDAKLNPHLQHASPPALAGPAGQPASAENHEASAYDDLPCSAAHNACYISPYGDVYPCVQMPLPTGNVRRQRFEDVWYSSPQMLQVRAIRESQLTVCAGCSIHQFCERCPGLAQMEGGDLLGAYERACELAEMNARLAGVANPVSAMHARASQAPVGLQRTLEGEFGSVGSRMGNVSQLVTISPARPS